MRQKNSSFALYVKSRNSSDSGDGNIIAALLFLPMIFFLILTAIDMGFYFNNANLIANAVRDGAGTAAIYDYTGSEPRNSRLEAEFGATWGREELVHYKNNKHTAGFSRLDWSGGDFNDSTPNDSVEMQVIQQLENSASLYNVDARWINCGTAGVVNENESKRVFCSFQWRYSGLPGSVWSFITGNEWRTTSVTVPSDVDARATNHFYENRNLYNLRPESSRPDVYRGNQF